MQFSTRVRAASAILVAATLAACSGVGSSAEPPEPAWSPVGEYSWTTSVQGQTVGGRLTIQEGAEGLTGTITPQAGAGVGAMSIDDAVVNGREVSFSADSGMGTLFMILDFTDDAFTGSWSMDAVGGDIRGQRVP